LAELSEIANHSSTQEITAAEAERESIKYKQIEYMKFKCDEKNDTIPDLSFWWKTNIPHTIVDDSKIDFPDPQEAINFYQQELDMDGIYG